MPLAPQGNSKKPQQTSLRTAARAGVWNSSGCSLRRASQGNTKGNAQTNNHDAVAPLHDGPPGLDLAAVLFLRYSMPTERLKSIFSLGAAASAKASLLCLLSYALIIPNVINEPIDNLITRDACAATTYGVVAFVSTTTLLLSVGWRGLHVLWTTLTVNFVAGLCYVLRATTTSTLVETSSA